MIRILPQAIAAADDYLTKNASAYGESMKRLDQVKHLIEGFETPYGLELLATVHWLMKNENIDLKNDEKSNQRGPSLEPAKGRHYETGPYPKSGAAY
jgi:hypothetical protein